MEYCRTAIARMHGYTPGEQPADKSLIKLNTNENPYPPTPAVAAALHGLDRADLRLYPPPMADALRRQAAGVFGLESPDWVLAGNGSDDLLTIAVRTFLDQGDTLAFLEPSYSLYPVLAGIQGAACRPVRLTADFSLPPDAARQAAGAKLFFLARPNAPTGNSFPLDEVERLAREFAGILWIDEAYADFAADNCLDLARRLPNVVVSRTMSKSYSLAGIRFGLAMARPELVAEMLKVKDSYNVNMLTQKLALAALGDQEYMLENVRRIRASRTATAAGLQRLGCRVLPSETNFLFVAPPGARTGADFAAGLRRHGILVRHFPGPLTGAFVRITIGTDGQMQTLLDKSAILFKEIC